MNDFDEREAQQPQRSFPRRALGRGTNILLWILRVYVIVAVPLVVFTFVRALAR